MIAILPLFLGLLALLGWLYAGKLAAVPVHSILERWLIYLLIGLTVVSWVGTVLAGMALFRWWWVAGVLLMGGAGLRWIENRTGLPEGEPVQRLQRTPILALVAVALLLIGAGWLYGRPAQDWAIGSDTSAYLLSGAVLARDGSFFFEPQPFWSTFPDSVRTFFYIGSIGQPTRHMLPFYQWTLTDQTLEIGFYPLPKVWIALAAWLLGNAAASWAAPVMGLVSLAALYGLARRSWGALAGIATLLLLGASFPQTWFARQASSEILTQVLFLSALYTAMVARQNAANPQLAKRLALWSGLALSALSLVRVEGPLLIIGAASLLLLGWQQRPSPDSTWLRTWIWTVGLASMVGTLLSAVVARHYILGVAILSLTPRLVPFFLAGVLVLVSGGLLIHARWKANPAEVRATLTHAARMMPRLVAGLWFAWALFAAWRLSHSAWGETLPGWVMLYWSVPLTVVSVAGIIWLTGQPQRRAIAAPELLPLWALGGALLCLYTANHYVTPVHPWAVRRLVAVALPALALGAAGLLVGVQKALWERLSRRVGDVAKWCTVGLVVLLSLAGGYIVAQPTLPLAAHEEGRGFLEQLERFAERFPPGSLLLWDNGGISRALTAPMELLLGQPSLVVYQASGENATAEIDRLIESALSDGREVYFIATDGNLGWHPQRWRLASQGASVIAAPILYQPTGRLPNASDLTERRFWLDVYRILPAESDASARLDGVFQTPMGAGSYPYLRSGFHGWDKGVTDGIVRWTNGDALLTLPWPGDDVQAMADFCLVVQLAAGRPEAEPAAWLAIEVEGAVVYAAQLDKAFAPTTLSIPVIGAQNRGLPELELRLRSSTFDAGLYWEQRDRRTLGVLVYGVRIAPLSECATAH